MISVYLPDNSIREVPAGTTPLEIANSISPRLAAVSVVALLTPIDEVPAITPSDEEDHSDVAMYSAGAGSSPRLVDLSTPLLANTRLALITERDP